MRTVAQLGGYVATHDDRAVQLQQYAGGTVRVALPAGEIELAVSTDYPWNGRVVVDVVNTPAADWALELRVPDWCEGATAIVRCAPGSDGAADESPVAGDPGSYLRVERRWAAGDRVELELPMAVRLTVADERIDAVRGCAALEVGPLVYCFEDHDQPDGVSVDEIVLTGDDAASVTWQPDLLGGIATVQLAGGRIAGGVAPFPYHGRGAPASPTPVTLTAVPYPVWANRGVRAMRVWVPLASEVGA
jgi:hypothetical protein